MNELDDARLRAHLERRSGIGEPARSLAAAVSQRAATSAQARPSPATRLGAGRGWLALAAVLSGLAVVVASAGFKPPQPAPDGGAPALTVFTPSQLLQLVTESPADRWVDRVVVVDADVELSQVSCRAQFPCPVGYLSGVSRRITIVTDSDRTFESSGHPNGEASDVGGVLGGPVALRLRGPASAELIGPVHANGGSGLVWSLESFADETKRLRQGASTIGSDGVALGPLFVVDAWLAQSPFAPPCPEPPRVLPSSIAPFTCGIQAWLSPRDVQEKELDTFGSAPAGGVRVQNNAYDEFAPNPARSGSLDTPVPRRALYLVRSILEFPNDLCAGCADGPAYVVARIDPISKPDTSPGPSPDTSSLTSLNASDLARFVAQTPAAEWRDRVVIVDADVELLAFACPAQGCSPGLPLGFVVGTDPELRVWPDPSPRYVDDTRPADAEGRIAGPVALRLGASGHIELIGPVETRGDAALWPHRAFVDEAQRLSSLELLPGPDGAAAGPLFVVDAWLGELPGPPFCPFMTPPPASVLPFTCGAAAWLTAEAFQPRMVTGTGEALEFRALVPSDGVRVQNGAYESLAPDPRRTGADGAPEPRQAAYLVRPILRLPEGSCFLCSQSGLAYIVARIDPIEILLSETVQAN